jgi:hypothetical protein
MNRQDETSADGMEQEVARMHRICSTPRLRRELLWLRAKEKEDEESVESLERTDPDLRNRMTRLLDERGISSMTDPERRRQALRDLWDERFDNA